MHSINFYIDIVRLLLDNGVNVDLTSELVETTLQLAERFYHSNIQQLYYSVNNEEYLYRRNVINYFIKIINLIEYYHKMKDIVISY